MLIVILVSVHYLFSIGFSMLDFLNLQDVRNFPTTKEARFAQINSLKQEQILAVGHSC